MEKRTVDIIVILIIAAIILGFFLFSNRVQPEIIGDKTEMTANQCTAKGGEIVNTLDVKSCSSPEDYLGVVTGLKCPCICCKK